MGPWAYYSPLLAGIAGTWALNDTVREQLPVMGPASTWLLVAGVSLLVGLQAQVLMFAAQGAFAQVLPVPIGKSMRGGVAQMAGWFLLGWVVVSSVTVVIGLESVGRAVVPGVIGMGMLLVAVGTYIWGLPTAQADFGREKLIGGGTR